MLYNQKKSCVATFLRSVYPVLNLEIRVDLGYIR